MKPESYQQSYVIATKYYFVTVVENAIVIKKINGFEFTKQKHFLLKG